MVEWFDTGSLYVRDSFQYRIIRSLLGVPDTISGWIFGSGGKQTARFLTVLIISNTLTGYGNMV